MYMWLSAFLRFCFVQYNLCQICRVTLDSKVSLVHLVLLE